MGKFYDEIPDFLVTWIKQQKIFWVATAPLSSSGHVNVSPKGYDTFHVVNETKVWYEDLTGSGIETIAHVQENGRITILFCAFEGPPRIVRLFGTGAVYEFDTPEYNALIPVEKRNPGSRSVIMLDVHKVGTSCGFSIPFYTYRSDRVLLNTMASSKELEDIKAECAVILPSKGTHMTALPSCDDQPSDPPLENLPLSDNGLKDYWKKNNNTSIDGLPGLLKSFLSRKTFDESAASKNWGHDDVSISTATKVKAQVSKPNRALQLVDAKVFAGFVLGIVTSALWMNFATVLRAKVL